MMLLLFWMYVRLAGWCYPGFYPQTVVSDQLLLHRRLRHLVMLTMSCDSEWGFGGVCAGSGACGWACRVASTSCIVGNTNNTLPLGGPLA